MTPGPAPDLLDIYVDPALVSYAVALATATREPASAYTRARFRSTVDLPSPETPDTTRIVFSCRSSAASSMFVRSERQASRKLLDVLHRLTDLGNTIIVIEHNLDVIRNADWIIDLGPEGGEGGGRLVAQGTPEQVARNKKSYTGQALANYFAGSGSRVLISQQSAVS